MILFLRDKNISPWNMKIPYFIMWFKNGLKAQKAPSTMCKKGRDIKKPCKR